VNDDVRSLDRLIESAFFADTLRQDDSLKLVAVLAAVRFDPCVGLLLLAKRETDGVTTLEEEKGNGGTDETGPAGDDGEDGVVVVESGGHGGRGCGCWCRMKKEEKRRKGSIELLVCPPCSCQLLELLIRRWSSRQSVVTFLR